MATAETARAGAPLERFGHVIAGTEVFPGGGSTFVSVNPTTGKAWAEFPLGVVGAITPWNSPLFLTIMAVAPALAAGNTVVIKPSEITPVGPILAAKLATEVGFPPGVINVVAGERAAGEAL